MVLLVDAELNVVCFERMASVMLLDVLHDVGCHVPHVEGLTSKQEKCSVLSRQTRTFTEKREHIIELRYFLWSRTVPSVCKDIKSSI